ncbi:MAG: hypothetical protein ACR9NN_23605 [Nostochopsis sp.]
MREGFFALGLIGFLIVTGVTIYNILSGTPVEEVKWPGGSGIKFGSPISKPSVTETTTPTPDEPTPEPSVTETVSPPTEPEVPDNVPVPDEELTPEPSTTAEPVSLDISGNWKLIDTTGKALALQIQQNENNVEMRVYEFNGYNTFIFQGIITGNKISGNFAHFSGLQGRGNFEVSSDGNNITGSVVNSAGSEMPFLARR